MPLKFINIVLLFGFILLSFGSSLCLVTKLNIEDVSVIVNNLTEEEDESQKDEKLDKDVFIEFFNQIKLENNILNNGYLAFIHNKLPQYIVANIIQPPEN